MIETVFYSLIFDYDIPTMENSGRHWAQSAYRGKDYIFSYSAASIATILHFNLTIDYRILTDDKQLLLEKLRQYRVDSDFLLEKGYGFTIHEDKEMIDEWKANKYCFWPLISSMHEFVTGIGLKGKRVVKLDNDLTCLKPLDQKFYDHHGSHVWKFERECNNGKDYWGEKMAAKKAFGTDRFKIFNTGIWSVHPDFAPTAREIPALCQAGADVDISSVSRFPDKPGVTAKMWACVDQTSNNYWLHKYQVPVMETHEYFMHHCYVPNKEGVLKSAEYLKK